MLASIIGDKKFVYSPQLKPSTTSFKIQGERDPELIIAPRLLSLFVLLQDVGVNLGLDVFLSDRAV